MNSVVNDETAKNKEREENVNHWLGIRFQAQCVTSSLPALANITIICCHFIWIFAVECDQTVNRQKERDRERKKGREREGEKKMTW